MKYNVGTLPAAGLEARWSRTPTGGPIIVARDPAAASPHQRTKWWWVDRSMWDLMKVEGVREGFDGATVLGNIFSVRI